MEENAVDSGVVQYEADSEEEAVILDVDYTEVLEFMYEEMQTQTEELVALREGVMVCTDQLEKLNSNVFVLVTFTVLTFAWSCMRQWRKNILKIGE